MLARLLLPLAAAVLLSSPAPGAEAEIWRVIGLGSRDSLPIRATPDAKAKVIARIPAKSGGVRNLRDCRNRPDEVGSKDGSKAFSPFWCKVEFKGITGWTTRANLAPDF